VQELSPEEAHLTFDSEFKDLTSEEELRVLEARFLGKNGIVRAGMRHVGTLPREEQAAFGQPWVKLERELKALLSERREAVKNSEYSASLQREYLDLTLPGLIASAGASHPVTITENECLAILRGFGFALVEGMEVEDAYHNFDALNIPEHHPAQQLQDTFWLSNGALLRSQFLTGIVLAGLSLRKQEVASSLGTPMQPPFGVHITDGHVKKSVRAVLVNGSDGLGQTASALVTDRKVKSYE